MCVRDHFYVCVYSRGLGTPTASQRNSFDSEKLTHFFFLLYSGRRRGSNLGSLDLESDAQPTEPPCHVINPSRPHNSWLYSKNKRARSGICLHARVGSVDTASDSTMPNNKTKKWPQGDIFFSSLVIFPATLYPFCQSGSHNRMVNFTRPHYPHQRLSECRSMSTLERRPTSNVFQPLFTRQQWSRILDWKCIVKDIKGNSFRCKLGPSPTDYSLSTIDNTR